MEQSVNSQDIVDMTVQAITSIIMYMFIISVNHCHLCE